MFVMLAEKLHEGERPAIIGGQLFARRVPFVPKWHRDPMRPHDMESEKGRERTKREKEDRPDNDRRLTLLVHRAAIIRTFIGSKQCHSQAPAERKNRWKIALDGRSKNMLIRSAIGRMSQSIAVFLTIAAWFCLSNHCALGLGAPALPAAAAAETTGCPMHSAPVKKKPAAMLPCCKDLRAVAAKAAASPIAAALRFVGVQDYAVEIFVSPPRVAIGVDGLDTGPPGAFSFAESVLQQSILAHAPPLLS